MKLTNQNQKRMAMLLTLILTAANSVSAQASALSNSMTPNTSGNPGTAMVQEFAFPYSAASRRFTSLVMFDKTNPPSLPFAISDVTTGNNSAQAYDLADLFSLMEHGNLAVAISQSAEAAAAGDLSGAKARRYPTLRGETSGAYLGNPHDAIAIPANAFAPMFPTESIPLIPAVDPFQYSFKLIGELPLFTWGKTVTGIQASESALGAAQLQLAKTIHEKRIQLQASWEALAYVAAAEEVLGLQAKVGQRLTSLAEQNLSSGFITNVELLDVRMKVKQTAIAQARLADNRERLLSGLASLAGLENLNMEQLSLSIIPAGTVPVSKADLQEAILTGNYDLAMAKKQLEARSNLFILAKTQARGLPDLGLRAELSYGGSRLPFSTDDWKDKTDWQLILSIGASGSLFGDAVKTASAVRAKAELNQARAQVEEGQRQLKAYIHESYLSLELLRSRLEYSILQQDFWIASLAQQQTILNLGGGSETEYLSELMKALGGIAEGYGILAEYRAVIVGLQGAAGMSLPQ